MTDRRVDAELVVTLYASATAMVTANMVAAVLFASALAVAEQHPPAAVWAVVVVAVGSVRLLLIRSYRRAAPSGEELFPWRRRFTLHALAYGVVYGLGVWMLWTPHPLAQLVVLLFLASVFLGGMLGLAAHVPTWVAFTSPLLVGLVVRVLSSSGPMQIYAATNLLFYAAALFFVRRTNAMLRQTIAMRFDKERLLEELREEKQLAEDANAAKSKFLAAASHDLRQPLHAVRLFLSALSTSKSDAERGELLDKLTGATSALGSLLDSLLDLSRADAGVVKASPGVFAARGVLDAMELEFADVARAKGLRFSVMPCSVWLSTDPELLTTMLRNLVSNAVRYTERGGVVVGCRRRERSAVIGVWDTGPGIPEGEHAAIFREFHQLGNPARARQLGLGLGLAIVQRFARLLGHEIVLASQQGAGSFFGLEVPRVDRRPPQPAETHTEPVFLDDLEVLVLDDDPDVVAATEALLTMGGR